MIPFLSRSNRTGMILPWGRLSLKLIWLWAVLGATSLYADTIAPSYPASYQNIIAAAKTEKTLQIYSNVHSDAPEADLLAAFKAKYPFITINYFDDDGALVYQRFSKEVAQGTPKADILWSSAMGLQEKLINDGYAQSYSSPEIRSIPSWAHWKDLGYGSTSEPIAFVYNRKFVKDNEAPHTHAALLALLQRNPARFHNRIATYDPEKSEVGMLFYFQDIRISHDAWNLFQAFTNVDAAAYSTSRDILTHVVQGDQWIGYDVIASYALEMQKSHPELEVIYPSDYVLNMSRVSFIAASAPHPNAARLFVDFLLSREGQQILANHGMGSVRSDVGVPAGKIKIDPIRTQAIRIGPGLLADLDSLVRAKFLRHWHQLRTSSTAAL